MTVTGGDRVKPGAAAIARYDPGTILDEAFSGPGAPRAHYAATLEALAEHDLGALRSAIEDDLGTAGCGFATEGGSDAFIVDPVPRIIPAGEFAVLAAGLEQRVRALDAFVAAAVRHRAGGSARLAA